MGVPNKCQRTRMWLSLCILTIVSWSASDGDAGSSHMPASAAQMCSAHMTKRPLFDMLPEDGPLPLQTCCLLSPSSCLCSPTAIHSAPLLPPQVSPGFRQCHGSLMHVTLDSAEVLVVVRGTDAESRRAAVALIQDADPASTGVPMRDVHQIHLDVKLNGGTVHFATNLKASPCLGLSKSHLPGCVCGTNMQTVHHLVLCDCVRSVFAVALPGQLICTHSQQHQAASQPTATQMPCTTLIL